MCEDTEKELEKAKIDVLRDAVKDASDTIRAIDRKIFFLARNTLAIIPIFATIMIYLKFPALEIACLNKLPKEFFTLLFIAIGTYFFVITLKKLIKASKPCISPLDNFIDDKDKSFANNSFFILAVKEKEISKFNLDNMVKDFDLSINNSYNLKKLLFKENIKVSYIRDLKMQYFGEAFYTFTNGCILSVSIILVTFLIKMFS